MWLFWLPDIRSHEELLTGLLLTNLTPLVVRPQSPYWEAGSDKAAWYKPKPAAIKWSIGQIYWLIRLINCISNSNIICDIIYYILLLSMIHKLKL